MTKVFRSCLLRRKEAKFRGLNSLWRKFWKFVRLGSLKYSRNGRPYNQSSDQKTIWIIRSKSTGGTLNTNMNQKDEILISGQIFLLDKKLQNSPQLLSNGIYIYHSRSQGGREYFTINCKEYSNFLAEQNVLSNFPYPDGRENQLWLIVMLV